MLLYSDARGFFQELLETALKNRSIRTELATERYLLDLLSGFVTADRNEDISTPFVEQLAKALQVSPTERVARMRCLGDAALFVSGFAAESMPRRGLSKSYCVSIGSRAYQEASRGSAVLQELALRFESFTLVFDEIRERTSLHTNGDLLRLYERWTVSGSPELLQRLSLLGISPSRGTHFGN